MTDESADNDEIFQKLLAECLESIERGEAIDREQLRREHPDFAESICEFLSSNKLVDDAVAALRENDHEPPVDTAFAPTLDSQASGKRTPFAIGDHLKYIGEYEVLEEIARGGMGIVFKARQIELRRTVALKMILAGRLASEADVDRFHREARSAAALQHPNIVGVHEVGQHEGHHYFTMDFVDGDSLAHKIGEGALAPRRTAELIKTVAEAIEYAHESGVLHRDLKPANILIDRDGQPHVTDFGLAKSLMDDATSVDLTASGQILGTPSYMAPEQASANHHQVSVASDIYSLGAIAYACLSGRAPFVADSTVDTIRQVIEKEPVSLRLLNSQVPKDLETICLKCLQKEPQRRYATAGELAQDLNRFLEGRPVVARPVAATTKLWSWGKRNPSVASLLMLSLFLLMGGTVVSSYFAVEASRRADAEAEAAALAEQERKNADQFRELADQARDLAIMRQSETRKQLYVAQISQAQVAWNQKNVGFAKELLGKQMPDDGEDDLRGFEWRYLNQLVDGQETIETGSYTRRMGISPDGSVAALKKKTSVQMWDLDSAEQTAVFDTRNGIGSAAPAFSFDGGLMAYGEDQAVAIIRVNDQKLVHKIAIEKGFHAAGLSFDLSGQLLAIAITPNTPKQPGARLECWDIVNFRRILAINQPLGIRQVAFRPHHGVIAALDEKDHVTQWDLSSGNEVQQWKGPSWIQDFSFNHDGKLLAASGNLASIFKSDNWQQEVELPTDNMLIGSMQFHPNGKHVVGGGYGQEVFLWDGESGNQIRSFMGHPSKVQSVVFRPRLKSIVSVDERGRIKKWHTDQEIGVVSFADVKREVGLAVFSPDGKYLAACERRPYVVSEPGRVVVWDRHSGEQVCVLDHAAGVASISFDATSTRLLSAAYDGAVILWDIQNGVAVQEYAIDVMPFTVRFHPHQSSVAAVADQVGRVAVFDTAISDRPKFDTGRKHEIRELNFSKTQRLSFHPDGNLIAACDGRELSVYDVETMKIVFNKRFHLCGAVEFNPNGKTLLCSSGANLHVLNVADWETLHTFSAHSRPVLGIGFSSDGTRVATNSDEKLVKVWETNTYQTVLTLKGDIPIPQFSPDGSMLVRGRRDDALELCSTNDSKREAPSIDGVFCHHRSHQHARLQYWDLALADALAGVEVNSDPYRKLDVASYALMAGEQEKYRECVGNAIEEFELEGVDKRLQLASRWAALAFMTEGVGEESASMKLAAEKAFETHRTSSNGISWLYCLLRLGEYQKLIECADEYEKFGRKQFLRLQAAEFRAIAHYELGNVDQANSEMQNAMALIAEALPPIGKGRNTDSDHSDWLIATVVIHQEACSRALKHLDKAIEAEPTDYSSLLTRAALHELFQRWEMASLDYQKLVVLYQTNLDHWLSLTKVAAMSGNTDAFRQLCPLLIQTAETQTRQGKWWAVARTCTLLPEVDDIGSVFFDKPIHEIAKSGLWHHRIAAVGLQYRRGNYEEAADILGPTSPLANDWQGKCRSMLWEVLIQFQLGNTDTARETFNRANAIITANFPSPGYAIGGKQSIAELELLRNEAQQMLDENVVNN